MDVTSLLSQILWLVLQALAVFAAARLLQYARQKWGAERVRWILELGQVAVTAVEQSAAKQPISAADKKAAAVTVICDLATRVGITVSNAEAGAIVEASVHAMKAAEETIRSQATAPPPDTTTTKITTTSAAPTSFAAAGSSVTREVTETTVQTTPTPAPDPPVTVP